MASIAIGAAGGSALVAGAGAIAHGVLASRSLQNRRWNPNGRGGFIGSVRGNTESGPAVSTPPPMELPDWSSKGTPTKEAPPAASEPASESSSSGSSSGSVVRNPRDVPIGGMTGKPAPPTPFGRFRKHKPTKLPKGHPQPYDPAKSP